MSHNRKKVRLQTNHGDITLELTNDLTPGTVKNFLEYVTSGFYEGTLFHRVIAGFMIQGGGFDLEFTQKPGKAPIQNEAEKGLSNTLGSVAMARTHAPHSASSQFFINVSDNLFLDFKEANEDGWGYCVFGSVIDGLDVVKHISSLPTGHRHGHQDVPIEDVVIEKALVLDETDDATEEIASEKSEETEEA